jgi:hypothetical protein
MIFIVTLSITTRATGYGLAAARPDRRVRIRFRWPWSAESGVLGRGGATWLDCFDDRCGLLGDYRQEWFGNGHR